MHSIFIWLLSCKGCGSCWYLPTLPDVDVTPPPPFDTAMDETEEEEDTAGQVDLPPSSVCDFEEVEPNDLENPQDLPLEMWMCGNFGQPLDGDVFKFDFDTDAWVRLWIRAGALGSSAQPRIFIFDDDEEFNADIVTDGTADLDRTFKLDEARALGIGLFEKELGSVAYGEEYFWRMRVSIVKSPVLPWNVDEEEPNDERDEAMTLYDGDRVFGFIEYGSRSDWYVVDVVEDGYDLVIDPESRSHGSPLHPTFRVWSEDATSETGMSSQTGENPRTGDGPIRVENASGRYWVQVGSNGGNGGIPFWYLLDVTLADPSE